MTRERKSKKWAGREKRREAEKRDDVKERKGSLARPERIFRSAAT